MKTPPLSPVTDTASLGHGYLEKNKKASRLLSRNKVDRCTLERFIQIVTEFRSALPTHDMPLLSPKSDTYRSEPISWTTNALLDLYLLALDLSSEHVMDMVTDKIVDMLTKVEEIDLDHDTINKLALRNDIPGVNLWCDIIASSGPIDQQGVGWNGLSPRVQKKIQEKQEMNRVPPLETSKQEVFCQEYHHHDAKDRGSCYLMVAKRKRRLGQQERVTSSLGLANGIELVRGILHAARKFDEVGNEGWTEYCEAIQERAEKILRNIHRLLKHEKKVREDRMDIDGEDNMNESSSDENTDDEEFEDFGVPVDWVRVSQTQYRAIMQRANGIHVGKYNWGSDDDEDGGQIQKQNVASARSPSVKHHSSRPGAPSAPTPTTLQSQSELPDVSQSQSQDQGQEKDKDSVIDLTKTTDNEDSDDGVEK